MMKKNRLEILFVAVLLSCVPAMARASVNNCKDNPGAPASSKSCPGLKGDPVSMAFNGIFDPVLEFRRVGVAGLDVEFYRTALAIDQTWHASENVFRPPYGWPARDAIRHSFAIWVRRVTTHYIVNGPSGRWYAFDAPQSWVNGQCLDRSASDSDPTNFTRLCVSGVNGLGVPTEFTWYEGDGRKYVIGERALDLPDNWLLSRIEDESGNQITVSYASEYDGTLPPPVGCTVPNPARPYQHIYVHQVTTATGEVLEFRYEYQDGNEAERQCRLASIVANPGTIPLETLVAYTYDVDGKLSTVTRPDGTRERWEQPFGDMGKDPIVVFEEDATGGSRAIRTSFDGLLTTVSGGATPDERRKHLTRAEHAELERFDPPYGSNNGCTWIRDLRVQDDIEQCYNTNAVDECSEVPLAPGCVKVDWRSHGDQVHKDDVRVPTSYVTYDGTRCSYCPWYEFQSLNGDMQASARRDWNGNYTTYLYDTSGRVIQETVNDRRPTCTPDDDPSNALVERCVDTNGVEQVAVEREFAYHPSGQLYRAYTSITEPSSINQGAKRYTVFDYDAAPAIVDGSINCTHTPASFNVAPGTQLTRVIEIGYTMTVAETTPQCHVRVTRFEYDANGRVTKVQYPSNHSSMIEATLSYYPGTDPIGQRHQVHEIVVDPAIFALTTEVLSYDTAGRPTKVRDPSGIESEAVYDWAGRPTWVKVGSAPATTVTYRPNGDIDAVSLPGGISMDFVYQETAGDGLPRLTKVVRTESSVATSEVRYFYHLEPTTLGTTDRVRRAEVWDVAAEPDVLSRVSEFEYDQNERLEAWERFRVSPTTPLATSRVVLDPMGALAQTQDEVHAVNNLKITRDGLGNVTKVQQLLGGAYDVGTGTYSGGVLDLLSSYRYADDGSLSEITDAGGVTTFVRTDDFGQRIERNSPDTGNLAFEYNHLGLLAKTAIGRAGSAQRILLYDYDHAGRLYQVKTDQLVVLQSYTYGSQAVMLNDCHDGSPLSLTNVTARLSSADDFSSGTRYFSYDADGRVAWTGIVRDWDPTCAFTTKWTYDAATGDVTSIRYPTGLLVTYVYSAAGRVSKVQYGTAPADLVTAVAYDGAGAIQDLTFSSGLHLTTSRLLDGLTEWTGLTDGTALLWGQGLSDLSSTSVDAQGNPRELDDLVNARLDRSFEYDELYRLSRAVADDPRDSGRAFKTWDYAYEGATGKRTTMVENAASGYQYRYDYAAGTNRLLGPRQGVGCRPTYTYSAAGEVTGIGEDCTCCGPNLVCGPDTTGLCQAGMLNEMLAYDDFGRLDAYTTTSGMVVDYAYDTSRMRMRKATTGYSEAYSYLPSGQMLSAEIVQGTRKNLIEYIWLGGRPIAVAVATLDGAGAVVSRDYQIVATDHLGTPWAVVDPDYPVGGTTVPVATWKAAYDPFGKAYVNAWEAHDLANPIVEPAGTGSAPVLVTRPALAEGISVHVEGLDLAHQCEWLVVRNADTQAVTACYTGTGPNTSGTFWTGVVNASGVTLEHLVPASCGVPAVCSGSLVPARAQVAERSCVGSCDGYQVSEVRGHYPQAVEQRLRFPGQYEDIESGLHYNWWRYYSAAQGRYVQADPVLWSSPYAYVRGQPTRRLDRFGLWDTIGDALEDHYLDDPELSATRDRARGAAAGAGLTAIYAGAAVYYAPQLAGAIGTGAHWLSHQGKVILHRLKEAGSNFVSWCSGRGGSGASTLHGPLNPGPLPANIANTFRSGTYTANTLSQPTTLYRAYGGSAGPLGSWWSRTPPAGPLQSQLDLALRPEWGNTATSVSTIQVPAGTTIYEGAAAAQGGLVGGGNQVFVPSVDPGWVVP